MTRRRKSEKSPIDWDRVLALRIQSKTGHALSDQDSKLLAAAYAQDPDQYTALNPDVERAAHAYVCPSW